MVALPADIAGLDAQLALTRHCVSRYRSRCAPDAKLGQARRELKERIVAEGRLSAEPPAWLLDTPAVAGGADAYVVLEEAVLPLRFADARGRGRAVATTVLARGFERPTHSPDKALAWAARRSRARELAARLDLSPTCVKRFAQRRGGELAHARLVEVALAGHLVSAAPPWASRLPRKDLTGTYLDCGDLWLVLEDRPGGGHVAVNCLWRDWEPTERQRGSG